MKSVICLLLLFTLVPAYHAIKCMCDNDNCVDGTGPQDECPDSLGEEYYSKHFDMLGEDGSIVVPLFTLREMNMRLINEEPELTEEDIQFRLPNWTQVANELWKNRTLEQKISDSESMLEIAAFVKANLEGGIPELKRTIEMVDQVLAGTYIPQKVDYQFCVKIVGGNGTTERACGVVARGVLGHFAVDGCHDNPFFDKDIINYPSYCRCDTDLCNAGEIKHLSSYLLLVLLLVKTFAI